MPEIDKFPLKLSRIRSGLAAAGPGVLLSLVLAIAAQFLSDHYGAPAMLLALLLGIAFGFLAEEGRCVPGIELSSQSILRIGVALLGVRISADLVSKLGWEPIALVIAGVFATIAFGLIGARLLGRGWRLALLTGGAVAICGASAAMAIASVLPKNRHSERNLTFTVLGVTVLSTLAMIVYPIVADLLALTETGTGVFFGGTIHDVAQVVGAGFSVSEATGETATVVKLIRVTMLAPVILIFGLFFAVFGVDRPIGEKPPLVPGFILLFFALAAANSFDLVPASVRDLLADISRWALLTAIAAVGMKTSLRKIAEVGAAAIVLICAETLFLAAFICVGIRALM